MGRTEEVRYCNQLSFGICFILTSISHLPGFRRGGVMEDREQEISNTFYTLHDYVCGYCTFAPVCVPSPDRRRKLARCTGFVRRSINVSCTFTGTRGLKPGSGTARAAPRRRAFVKVGVEKTESVLHRALTSAPPSTFGIRWGADRTPGLLT